MSVSPTSSWGRRSTEDGGGHPLLREGMLEYDPAIDQQARTLPEVLQGVAGISLTESGGFGKTASVFMRCGAAWSSSVTSTWDTSSAAER